MYFHYCSRSYRQTVLDSHQDGNLSSLLNLKSLSPLEMIYRRHFQHDLKPPAGKNKRPLWGTFSLKFLQENGNISFDAMSCELLLENFQV